MTYHNRDIEADAAADADVEEITVTPEMIEAGIAAPYERDSDPSWCSDEDESSAFFAQSLPLDQR